MAEKILLPSHQSIAKKRESSTKLVPALVAILFGAFIIAAVGFAPGIAHEAAHDTRHVMIFPCH